MWSALTHRSRIKLTSENWIHPASFLFEYQKETMLTFKLQRQTVVTLVGLSFLCILPMVAAFDVRKSSNVEPGTLRPLGSHNRIDSLRSLTLHLILPYISTSRPILFCLLSGRTIPQGLLGHLQGNAHFLPIHYRCSHLFYFCCRNWSRVSSLLIMTFRKGCDVKHVTRKFVV